MKREFKNLFLELSNELLTEFEFMHIVLIVYMFWAKNSMFYFI